MPADKESEPGVVVDGGRPMAPPTNPRLRPAALAAVVVVAAVVALVVGSKAGEPAPTTPIPDLVAPDEPGASPSESPTVVAGSGVAGVDPDAPALRGTVVVAPFPAAFGDGTEVTVLQRDGGSSVRMPLYPGDFPFPLVMESDHLVFADLDEAYLVDLQHPDRSTVVSEASFVVPSATAGQVWLVGEDVEWMAPLDVLSAAVGERIDTSETVAWPLAGVTGGMLVEPVDEPSFGRVAYWRPGFPLEAFPLPDPARTGVMAAAGDTAVLVSPGGAFDVVDVPTRRVRASFEIDFGDDLVVDACLSPQALFVAVTGTSGRSVVVSTSDGTHMLERTVAQPVGGVAWTTPDQMLVIVDGEEGTELQAVDVFTGLTVGVADLDGPGWWLAASGSSC